MSLYSGQASLKRASQDLFAQWEQTRLIWRDDISRKFEERYIEPLVRQIRTAREAIEHMDGVVGKIRRDCGE
jgi:hypothetical protein